MSAKTKCRFASLGFLPTPMIAFAIIGTRETYVSLVNMSAKTKCRFASLGFLPTCYIILYIRGEINPIFLLFFVSFSIVFFISILFFSLYFFSGIFQASDILQIKPDN